jgi:hypothetical protein
MTDGHGEMLMKDGTVHVFEYGRRTGVYLRRERLWGKSNGCKQYYKGLNKKEEMGDMEKLRLLKSINDAAFYYEQVEPVLKRART